LDLKLFEAGGEGLVAVVAGEVGAIPDQNMDPLQHDGLLEEIHDAGEGLEVRWAAYQILGMVAFAQAALGLVHVVVVVGWALVQVQVQAHELDHAGHKDWAGEEGG
jgi:hypothetical protein